MTGFFGDFSIGPPEGRLSLSISLSFSIAFQQVQSENFGCNKIYKSEKYRLKIDEILSHRIKVYFLRYRE